MSNKLNNFDQLLKSKLDQHTVPFNEGDWSKLEKSLPSKTGKSILKNPWLWSGAATVALIVTSVVLFNSNTEKTESNNVASNEDITVIDKTKNTKNSETEIQEQTVQNETSSNLKNNNNIQIINKEDEAINNSSNNNKTDNINIYDTETIASNKETEATTNTTSTVDSSLSPTVTPEDFNTLANVEKPKAQIICKNTELCSGSIFTFETIKQKDVDFLWSFGDETFSKEQNPTHTFKKPGTYQVGLIVRSKIDNSVLTKAKEILVNVLASPKVNFESEETINHGIPAISFINTTDKANDWSWKLGDGNVSIEKDPYHNYKRKGIYNVSLTATSKEGCASTATKEVYIENDYNLLAPNSFTPNGDGINDFFIPEALKVMDVEFSMSIFGTANGLVFETKNINQQWDGINQQTGDKCKGGNYIWVVTLTNHKGKTEQYKGAVLILE